MQTNPTWKDWFVFSKKERIVVVPLVFLLVIYLLFRFFYQPEIQPVAIENLDEKIARLSSQTPSGIAFQNASSYKNRNPDFPANANAQLFYFDPNTLDEAGFLQLGLRRKVAHTIVNYRSKGGHFYKPDDLRKIYGLQEEEADRLIPYVKIISSNSNTYPGRYKNDNYSSYHKQKPQVIDINTATVAQWKSLPAIGDVLSNRIVNYRDKIGGFSSAGDVKKVYGITDSTYQVILPYLSFSGRKDKQSEIVSSETSARKININKASAAELKSNPNISSDIAEAIVIYRKQHGNYSSVEGIRRIVFITSDVYQKIAPFLTVE